LRGKEKKETLSRRALADLMGWLQGCEEIGDQARRTPLALAATTP
jgi:hypothetical protein